MTAHGIVHCTYLMYCRDNTRLHISALEVDNFMRYINLLTYLLLLTYFTGFNVLGLQFILLSHEFTVQWRIATTTAASLI